MPYIKEEHRKELLERTPENCGELNYLFTKIAIEYISRNECYQAYNDVMGALEGCKLELYRRHAAPYEDVKIRENGDVTNER